MPTLNAFQVILSWTGSSVGSGIKAWLAGAQQMCSLGEWALLWFHLTAPFNYLWLLCLSPTVLHDTAELFQYTAYLVSLFHDFLHISVPHFNFHHHTNTIFEPITFLPAQLALTQCQKNGEEKKNMLLLQVSSPSLLQHGSGTLTWLQSTLNKKHHCWSHLVLFGILFNITRLELWANDCRCDPSLLHLHHPWLLPLEYFKFLQYLV